MAGCREAINPGEIRRGKATTIQIQNRMRPESNDDDDDNDDDNGDNDDDDDDDDDADDDDSFFIYHFSTI